MTGTVAMAAVWTLAVAAGLLAWPWLLALLAARRPGWLPAPLTPSAGQLRQAWRGGAPADPLSLAAWCALVLLAALLPTSSGWVAADLDAGLLWVLTLAVICWLAPGRTRLTPATAAGAVITLAAACLPVVLRAATLNLTDLVVAQQGGAHNWFLVREPFLLLSGGCFLVTVAALWSDQPAAGRADPWSQALAWGRPLVAAHVFGVLFLGGWWAFVPFLDGLPWLNSLLKALVALAILAWLRRRRWVTPALLLGWLPPVALLVCLASLAWLILGGAIR